ncbi:MAG: dehypoxanthine futalosine cyclase [Bacteroidales bacterium]|nr:dehypoxanthine futalosine cyclase [Bacteroidales bacterium]
MNQSTIIQKALDLNFLSKEEGNYLYNQLSLPEIAQLGNSIKMKLHPHQEVGWIVDRNINITNICIGKCKFCNFHRLINQEGTYITTREEYKLKIDELISLGGNQILLQGGMHPKLDIVFYEELFRNLKQDFPTLKLHALGPPEIAHIARVSKLDIATTIHRLVEAGLDSLPGAGAEILVDEVRSYLSPGKCDSDTWLNVMEIAHRQKLTTSATMMFGHIETFENRIDHLIKIRDLQQKSLNHSEGFTAFILWPFQKTNTVLEKLKNIKHQVTTHEYIKMLALSRIMLPNIKNIQASWLTTGIDSGMLSLHAGANDMGSIMIEENVVSAAGSNNSLNKISMINTIEKAGFIPRLRNQRYEFINY